MSNLMEHSTLAAYFGMARIPKWTIVDAGVHEYFQQYHHCSAERTEIYDQIRAEVHDLDIQHTIAFFHNFLEDEYLEHFYAELYRLLYWALHAIPGAVTRDFPYDAIGTAIVPDEPSPTEHRHRSDDTQQEPAHVIEVLDSSSTGSAPMEATVED